MFTDLTGNQANAPVENRLAIKSKSIYALSMTPFAR